MGDCHQATMMRFEIKEKGELDSDTEDDVMSRSSGGSDDGVGVWLHSLMKDSQRKAELVRFAIAGTVILWIALVAIVAAFAASNSRGAGTEPLHKQGTLGSTVPQETKALENLCPEGMTSFELSELNENVVYKMADFAIMLAEAGVEAELTPDSCSSENLAVLALAMNTQEDWTTNTFMTRYVLGVLYFSLHGSRWRNNAAWFTDDHCRWHGITCNDDGDVIGIDLVRNYLFGALPHDFQFLSHLEDLNLQNNAITGSLPASIGSLEHLASLELSFNVFSGSVPEELWELTKLELIDLTEFGGSVATIPTQIGQFQSLARLLAPNTGLEGEIPSELGDCASLRFLDLSKNTLRGAIPTQLGQLQELQTLYLTGNAFDEVPTELCTLMDEGKLIAFDYMSLCSSTD